MKLYGKARKRARYRHWETWATFAVFALCIAAAAYFGSYWGHRWAFLVVAVIVGGGVTHWVERYVDRQHNQ